MYAKDPYEAKYQYLINKREGVDIEHFSNPKAFIEYSNDMHDVYKNNDEYNHDIENKILIIFDDMIADMIHNKKLNSIVTKLFIRGRKWNISLAFITQSYSKVPKDVSLNTSHFFITKIPNKAEPQQIAISHSSDVSTKDLIILIKIMTNNDQIRDEKLQYDINREATKISALSSVKIYKYEYLTGEDILPCNQQQIIEQARFTYSPLGKAFEKQIKTIEDQGKKQVDALKVLEPKVIESGSNNNP